jgi:hypothetical protein
MAKKQVYDEAEAQRILPLLVSIGREIKNRIRAIDETEARLARKDPPALSAEEKLALQGELAVHKREMRRTLRELEELGCKLDADHPLRILIPGFSGPMAFEGSLERTMFRLRTAQEQST